MSVLFEKWGREIDNPRDSALMFLATGVFTVDTALWAGVVAMSEDGFDWNFETGVLATSVLGLIVSALVNRAWVKIRA